MEQEPPALQGTVLDPQSEGNGLRALELFCGAGGLTTGFRAAGFDVVLGLDDDQDASNTYALNHGTARALCDSVDNISASDIKDLARGQVDVVLGGPSCQGFSTAGRKNGWVREGDERNNLWSYMRDVVRHLQPSAFLFENVPGLLHYDKGSFAKRIFAAFQELGYQVHCRILLAADYNVPQLRRRVFVVGIRSSTPFEYPESPRLGAWRRDTISRWEEKRAREGKLPHLTCWEAIGDLPALGEGTGHAEWDYGSLPVSEYAHALRGSQSVLWDHEVAPLAEHHLALVSQVPMGGTWRDIPPHLLPDRLRGVRRTDSTNLYGRLDPSRPAYTLTTQFNNVTTGCNTHPFEDRTLTVREGARLQSFPDSYRFSGSLATKYRLVGNAVPPLQALALGKELAAHLLGGNRPEPFVVGRRSVTAPSIEAPSPSSPNAHKRMQAQKGSDTAPEVALRRELFARGFRYRKGYAVPGLPRRRIDIAFVGRKVAVFVHGCFWHGCPEHHRPTKSNTKWWADKISRNRRRDAETKEHLQEEGWKVLVVWEHEDPRKAALRVETELHEA